MGTFHKISPKHMDRYVTEFTGRHNARERDTLAQMREIARGMVRRRLKYAELIRWTPRAPACQASARHPNLSARAI